jgi:hypothetical protein
MNAAWMANTDSMDYTNETQKLVTLLGHAAASFAPRASSAHNKTHQ